MSSSHNILGVPINASKSEIKRAYYRKARLLHPDVNKSPNAEEEFIRLNMAYEALTNPKFIIKSTQQKTNNKSSTQNRAEDNVKEKTSEEKRREEVLLRREMLRNEAIRKSKIKCSEIIKKEKKELINYQFIKIILILFLIIIFIPVNIIGFEFLINYDGTIPEQNKKFDGMLLLVIFFSLINILLILNTIHLIFLIIKNYKSLYQSQS